MTDPVIVKAKCVLCGEVHEWELGAPFGYPEDFKGDKRLMLFRPISADKTHCGNPGQMVNESELVKDKEEKQ